MKIVSGNIKRSTKYSLLSAEILTSLFRFFELFCDGLNIDSQEILRGQFQYNIASVNIVQEIIKSLLILMKDVRKNFFIYFENKVDDKFFHKLHADTLEKSHKYLDWRKINFRFRQFHFLSIRQGFDTLIEISQGLNVPNMLNIFVDFNIDEINSMMEFFSCYFKVSKFHINNDPVTYYGCLSSCVFYFDTFFSEGSSVENLENEETKKKNSSANRAKISDISSVKQTVKFSNLNLERNYEKSFGLDIKILSTMYDKPKHHLAMWEKITLFHQLLFETEIVCLKFLNFILETKYYLSEENLDKYLNYVNQIEPRFLLDCLNSQFLRRLDFYMFKTVIFEIYVFFLNSFKIELNPERMVQIKSFKSWMAGDKSRRPEKYLASVEIVNVDGRLIKVFFPIAKKIKRIWHFSFINSFLMDLLDNINRDNPDDKVRDIFEEFSYFIEVIVHQNNIGKLAEMLPYVGVVMIYIKNLKKNLIVVFCVTGIVVNMILLFYTEDNAESNIYLY